MTVALAVLLARSMSFVPGGAVTVATLVTDVDWANAGDAPANPRRQANTVPPAAAAAARMLFNSIPQSPEKPAMARDRRTRISLNDIQPRDNELDRARRSERNFPIA
ncbi:hypothetical protein [Luteimonas sp. TWI382]|uniref:hypothetical protein n=1 Tax=Luteimonas sp. TWI382 TaxID=3136776 RepID=UPI0032091665